MTKNPLMYGNNSKLLTSSIASVSLEGNIAPTIKFKSKLPAYRYMQRFTPKTFPKDPDRFMYLRIDVKSKEDTLIAYLNPEDVASGSENLYTIFLSKTKYPRQSKGKYDWKRRLSVRDLTKDGFKFIIPPNVCDEGVCYLGIQPMKGTQIIKHKICTAFHVMKILLFLHFFFVAANTINQIYSVVIYLRSLYHLVVA